DFNFQTWLDTLSKEFKFLSQEQQLTTFQSLLQQCSPSQRYNLSADVSNILCQDILLSVPPELLEQICHYIDAKSLTYACCVCKEWNGLISVLDEVWRRKCLHLGIGSLKDAVSETNWKSLCIATLRQREGIRTGLAFRHQDLRATCLTLEQITVVDYCNGYLIASKEIKRISCMKVEDMKMLVLGHSSGHITSWNLDISEDNCDLCLWKDYFGHTGVIMSISLSIELDLVLSGGTDFMAKIWILSTGTHVQTLSCHTHWVIQVTLLPTLERCNDRTLFTGKHSLLTKTRDHIRIFSWPTISDDGCVYGNLDEINNSVVEIALNPVQNFYTPGSYVHNGNVAYIKQSMVKDDEDGNAEIVLESLETGLPVAEVHLRRKVRKLLAVGDKFALILLPHSHSDKFNLLVVELESGSVAGGCHLPHSSSTTPDLAQVIVGETGWLNGLENLKPHDLVVALGMLNGQIRVVTWWDMRDKLTG
ncbi:hypothetical protein C0J52_19221, partial [Blattella germanica]